VELLDEWVLQAADAHDGDVEAPVDGGESVFGPRLRVFSLDPSERAVAQGAEVGEGVGDAEFGAVAVDGGVGAAGLGAAADAGAGVGVGGGTVESGARLAGSGGVRVAVGVECRVPSAECRVRGVAIADMRFVI